MLSATVISTILELYQGKQLFPKALLVVHSDHGNCTRGFTLIELITIMVIVFILLAVGIPAYMSWVPDMKLRSAIRDIKSDIEMAKSRAIRENTSCALVFDTSTNPDSYMVFMDNVSTNLVRDAGEPILKTVDIPKNVSMTGASFDGVAAVGFNGRGLPYTYDSGPPAQVLDLANPGTVTLQNTKNNYRRVRLTIVGLSRIQRSTNGTTWVDD
ncbi:MAG: GspH/FimT family pseudopilin [Deltaproteobacteria bacterium]|nr:GspH/FimT family pseudopilin [Deltaproteobacteria bacterium]